MDKPKNPIVYNNRGDYVKPFKMITVIDCFWWASGYWLYMLASRIWTTKQS